MVMLSVSVKLLWTELGIDGVYQLLSPSCFFLLLTVFFFYFLSLFIYHFIYLSDLQHFQYILFTSIMSLVVFIWPYFILFAYRHVSREAVASHTAYHSWIVSSMGNATIGKPSSIVCIAVVLFRYSLSAVSQLKQFF